MRLYNENYFTCNRFSTFETGKGQKGTEDHLKMAIESWLSERNKITFAGDTNRGNNYSNIMWKSTTSSKYS